MNESLLTQLRELRHLFAEAVPNDKKTIEDYGWTISKSIIKHMEELDALTCRQLLADAIRLPIARPSALYSSILTAAIKMAGAFTDFHFVPFLNIWNPATNLRKEDYEQGKTADGKVFPSLAERMTKACLLAQLIRPEEKPSFALEQMFGYHNIQPMIVTKVTQSEVKGRKMYFAHLFGLDGEEIIAETHTLRSNPLSPSDKKHYVNVGQLYNTVLRDKQDGSGVRLVDAVLSSQPVSEVFPSCIGYIDFIDTEHNHIHIYDSLSRHFVSSGQRFVNAKEKQFVLFVPIVPNKSKFKSAIILPTTKNDAEMIAAFPPREIKITSINTEKQYCSWELTDKSNPITEQLSPLQISQGEASPSFTCGFASLDIIKQSTPNPTSNQILQAIIYLRRGKDKAKRPFVAIAI